MTDTKKVQLGTEVDASGARRGFDEIKQAGRDMARDVAQAGDQAARAMDGIGSGGTQASQKVDTATKSIIGSLERATAALKAGEKGTADYYEALANQRGVNLEVLKPYLDQLRQAEAAQKAAQASLGGLGNSAGQTAAALRQVPAQLQDIIVSLQGGQEPMTVLLQQGSQLASQFGGVGEAARALGGYLLGLVSPFTVAAAGAAALALGLYKGSQESKEFSQTLITTGNAAGLTVTQLNAAAQAAAGLGGGSQSRAAAVLNEIAAGGQVAAGSLARFAAQAVDMERAGASSASKVVEAFNELGKKPLEASIKLNEATNYLTASVYEQIKALEAQGRTVEAGRVAQEAYYVANADRIPALLSNLGYVERAWLGIKDAISSAGSALASIGRPGDVLGDQIRAIEDRIVQAQRLLSTGGFAETGGGAATGRGLGVDQRARLAAELEANKERLRLLQQGAAWEALSAQYQAQYAAQRKAGLEFDKEGEKYLSRQAQMEREIAQARSVGLAAGREQQQIEDRIAAIREKYAGDKGAKSTLRDRQDEIKLLAQLAGLTSDFAQDWERLNSQYRQGRLSVEALEQAQRQLLQSQPFAKERAREQAQSAAEMARAYAEVDKAYRAQVEGLEKAADAVSAQAQKLQDEEAAAAMAAASNLTLAQAIQQVTIARLSEQRTALLKDGRQEAADAVSREIDERKKLIELMGRSDARDAARKSAEQAATEWRRAAERIEDSITDALMRGFESGKTFAQNLRDTAVNMFRTLVFRPTIQAIVAPLAGGITGMLGLSGAANAASSVLGGLGGLAGGVDVLNRGGIAGLGGIAAGAGGLAGIGQAIGAGIMNTISGGSLLGGKAAGLLAGGGSTASGLAGLAGAALPWIGGAALIGNALGLFSKTELKGTSLRGTLGDGSINEFDVSRRGGSLFRGPTWSETDRGASAMSGDIQKAYEEARRAAAGMAEVLGGNAEAIRSYTQSLYIDGNGKSPEEMQKLLADALTKANDQLAIMALGTTLYYKEGETATQTLVRLSTSLQTVNGVLDQLGKSALETSTYGGVMASQLADLFGGLDVFVQTAGGYYQAYYTEAERAAKTTQQVSKALADVGLSLPASREEFRRLVEAQDLSTEAGRKAYAALLQTSGAFASITQAAEGLGNAATLSAKQMAEAGRQIVERLTQQRGSLEVDLLRAQGNTAAADALARQQALADYTRGLSESDKAAVTALYDYNLAIERQVAALEQAAQAQRTESERVATAQRAEADRIRAVASERYNLESRLLQLQGDKDGLRQRELLALDASNRAWLEQIHRLEDQRAAAEQAAQALQAFQATMAGLGNTRFDLENQLLKLQGRDGEAAARVRDKEIAELTQGRTPEEAARIRAAYELNEQLRRQVAEAEAAAAAAEALARAQAQAAESAARAAEQLKTAWQGLSNSVFEEVARIRGLDGSATPGGLAEAQARLTNAQAQARAGDQDAARQIPALSQAMLALAQTQANSQRELTLIRASTAASLEALAKQLAGRYGLTVPQFEVGTNYVPRTTLAVVHEGEAIVPRAFNPAAFGGAGGNAELVAEVRALREEVASLRRAADKTASNTGASTDLLREVTLGGVAMQTKEISTP